MSEEKAVQVRPPVDTQGGVLSFDNLDSLQRLSAYLHASRMLPKQYDTPEKIGAGIQFAVQLGFKNNWLIALRQIAVINGTPSIFGDLPLALVRESGELISFDEYLVDKNQKRICIENTNLNSEFDAAICTAERKGGFKATVVFTVEDAKKAKIWDQNVWKVYPKRMIQMRARSMVLKDMFSDVLNGASIGEYDHNTTIEKAVESEVTTVSAVGKLNALIQPKQSKELRAEDARISVNGIPIVPPAIIAIDEATEIPQETFDKFMESRV